MASKLDWWDRIRRAAHRGQFTSADLQRARNWTTCACGEQNPLIPRRELGVPVDDALATLGADFALQVNADVLDGAAATLVKIERRAAALLHDRAELKRQRAVLKAEAA